jgi:hypothetical protein
MSCTKSGGTAASSEYQFHTSGHYELNGPGKVRVFWDDGDPSHPELWAYRLEGTTLVVSEKKWDKETSKYKAELNIDDKIEETRYDWLP